MTNGQTTFAGFWCRTWAALLDLVVFPLATVPLLYAIHGRDYFKASIAARGPVDFANTFLLADVLLLACWLACSATPGKLALSLRIVDARTGARPSPRQYLLRNLGFLLSALPLGLGFLYIAYDPRKQGWHDKLAGTAVIRTKR